jgi:hypothetical protein
VCWKSCSSCRSFHLLREEFLSAPIHSPLSGSPYRSFIKDNNLFKLAVCTLLLKCITQDQGMELMNEIHGGMCGSHIAARALARKAFRQGFYWPMAIKDA